MMKQAPNMIWLACAFLLVPALACSFGDSDDEANTGGERSGGDAEAGIDEPSDDAGIEGEWDLTGADPDGSEYDGSLEIEYLDPVYVLTWEISGSTDTGTGLLIANSTMLAAAYPRRECSLAAYERTDNWEQLRGDWVAANGNDINSESGTFTDDEEGDSWFGYAIQGTNRDGSDYLGALLLSAVGDVYTFGRRIDDIEAYGTGIPIRGGWIIASFGLDDANCGVAVYEVGDDSLDGVWAEVSVGTTPGQETATR